MKKYLADVSEKLLKEWDYTKNGDLTPEKALIGSGKNRHWICKRGHKFQSRIASRLRGDGCPYCSGRKLLKGFNDLATRNRKLAKEWDYIENGDLTPKMVTPHSNKKAHWKCSKCGHKWMAVIADRSNGNGCPVCAIERLREKVQRNAIKGNNTLAAKHPRLAEEWHPARNGDLTPHTVAPYSNKKVFWQCNNCAHVWAAIIASRSKGNGCPICALKRRRKKV